MNRLEVCALENDESSTEHIRFINAIVFAARLATNCGFVGFGAKVQSQPTFQAKGSKLIQHRIVDDSVAGGSPCEKLWHDVAVHEAQTLQVAESTDNIIQKEGNFLVRKRTSLVLASFHFGREILLWIWRVQLESEVGGAELFK